jgi:nitrite reductase/ring-hydroxylating ferredoxin subunit
MPHVDVALANIPMNAPFRVEHDGMGIVMVRTESQISSFEDTCPHAYWPLSEGILRDGVLECPGHGWEFNASTGRCVNAPAYALTPITAEVIGDVVRLQWEAKASPARA